jgi:hypothetical protein
VLVSPSEVPAKQRVYIGEADVLRNRLDRHQANIDFWTRVRRVHHQGHEP